jgi:hypothetical protein
MSFDIRRASKADLDRLNQVGREWRERGKSKREDCSDGTMLSTTDASESKQPEPGKQLALLLGEP